MDRLSLYLIAELSLAFGLAGLFWPERFMPVFQVLLFPWVASYRAIRANSLAAIALALLLSAKLVAIL